MATDRKRRAAATATLGAVYTAGGGMLRHKGIEAAHHGRTKPDFNLRHPIKTHPTRALLRAGAKGRKTYALGATLGLVGAPAFAVGAHDYLTAKRDDRKSFVSEGLTGTRQALEQRAQGMREVPPQHRAGPLAVSALAGAGGSLAAHRAMDRTNYFRGAHHGGRAGLAALAGTAAAAASFPVARHAVRSREYEVTPAGVRRRKRPAARPSSKGTVYDQKRMSRRAFRDATVGTASKVHNPHNLKPMTSRGTARKVHWEHHEGGKSMCGLDGAFGHGNGPFAENYGEVTCRGCARMLRMAKADYLGRHVTPGQQRAKTMAAGAIPLVPFAGPAAAARQAGRYAPPGEKRKAQGRQALSSAATTATGVGGAYLAAGNKKVGAQALRGQAAMQRATDKVTGPVKSRVNLKTPGGHRLAEAKARGAARATRTIERSSALRRAAKPLRANKPAAIAGYLAGSKLSGQVWGNLAISRNQAAQRRYDLKHPATETAAKADTGMSRREQRELIQRKRRNLVGQRTTAGLGLAGATMGAALLPGVRGRLKPKTVGRLERAAVGTGLVSGGIAGVHSLRNARLQSHELDAQERALEGTKAARFSKSLEVLGVLQELHKADKQPLSRMREDQAHHIVQRYGTAGPLPKDLGREDRMRAYEARYVHAGGHKAEHWQRRADIADKVKTGGLAGATAAGAGILALRHPRVVRALGHRAGNVHRAVDSAAIGAATVSGAGELYAGHARRRRSSYSNAKAGVAASALRRMRDYSG